MRLITLTLSILLGVILLQVVAAVLPSPFKPGTCPKAPIPITSCTSVKPEEHPECKNDMDCKDKKKCCLDGCHMKCKDPVEPPKPGSCPAVPLPVDPCPRPSKPNDECQTDEQCTGKKKCCHDGCQMKCKDPEVPKPGKCPAVPLSVIGCHEETPKKQPCFNDQDCDGKKKCCHNGCQMICKDPEVPTKPPKPGDCPQSPIPFIPCDKQTQKIHHLCDSDQDCDGKKKCCLYICTRSCHDPKAPPKLGNCPAVPLPVDPCPRPEKPSAVCQTDDQCKGKQKCCHDGCQMKCKDPEEPPKPGNCPAVPVPVKPCPRPEKPNDECQTDEKCTGKKKCCHDGCKMMCKDPEEPKPGNCPAVPLPVNPCPRPSKPNGECQTDEQCTGKKKCCQDGCKMMCKDPEELKPGNCPPIPLVLKPCRLPEKPYNVCQTDRQCTGKYKCCHDGCQMVCKYPID